MNLTCTPDQILKHVKKWASTPKPRVGDDIFDALPNLLRGKLYKFQREGYKFVISRQGKALIADEMGLGKTIQAIAVALYYRSEWPLLVICPSSMKYPWKDEILKWTQDLDRPLNS